MIQKVILSNSQCKHILNLKKYAIGYSNVILTGRDYSEWLIESYNFNFLLELLDEYKIKSLPNGRIIEYKKGNFFDTHKDQHSNHPERYKTLIIQLTDMYDGGELKIGNEYANKDVGNCILFDASEPHSVSEIKNGIRNSLVFWLEYKNMYNTNLL